jgi:2'-5' RNA ligase
MNRSTRLTDEFEKAARPLMEYLAKNYHPHVTVLVDSVHAELVEGLATFRTEDYIE